MNLKLGWKKGKGISMASIRERNGKFNVIYNYKDDSGKRRQKWETYDTKAEAKKRKREIEYKQEMGALVVRKCNTLSDLLTEYVSLYGKEKWALSTYEGNVGLIRNYIERSSRKKPEVTSAVLLLLGILSIAFLVYGTYNPFLYFRF